jgi:drug/metabolite transporter (DMT)-like permease
MKRRIRPIAHARDEPVLEWIYITIFDMARIISLSRIRCPQNPRCRMPRSLRADAHSAELLHLLPWVKTSELRPENDAYPRTLSFYLYVHNIKMTPLIVIGSLRTSRWNRTSNGLPEAEDRHRAGRAVDGTHQQSFRRGCRSDAVRSCVLCCHRCHGEVAIWHTFDNGNNFFPERIHFHSRCLCSAPIWRASFFKNRSTRFAYRKGRPRYLRDDRVLSRLSTLALPDVATLGQTYPLLLVALAGPLLGEVPDRRQIIATALGFLGVLVIVAPVDGFSFQVWHVLPLIGSLCLALNLILLRRLSARETQSSLILYTPLLTSVVTGVSLPWSWTSPSSGSEWLLLATMGIFGGIAFFLRNLAYSRSPASELAPVEYTQILFASILGIVVFGSSPSSHLIVGAALIVASNAWLLRVQASVKRKMMVSTSGLGEER